MPKFSEAEAIEALWRGVAGLRCAHHTPGRIRLKLIDGAPLDGFDPDLLAGAARASGVRAIRVNWLARSCVVDYDPAIILPAQWDRLLSGVRDAGTEALVRTLLPSVAGSAA